MVCLSTLENAVFNECIVVSWKKILYFILTGVFSNFIIIVGSLK